METQGNPKLPRISIQFCTQCRWMLRAAYYAQELLSTFSTSLGEVALVPVTGGTFNISINYVPDLSLPTQPADSTTAMTTGENQRNVMSNNSTNNDNDNGRDRNVRTVLLWDRKAEGGFPETKVLKQRVRDCIEPGRNLGHSDVGGKKGSAGEQSVNTTAPTTATTTTSHGVSKADDKSQSDSQACGPEGC